MVLSTMNKSAVTPWSAPVYFLYSRGSFYFLSSPKSCHIIQSVEVEAAASIFSQARRWSNIQGIQMLGNVSRIKAEQLAKKVVKKYLTKFEVSNDLFPFLQVKKTDILHYLFKKFGAGLYSFKPCKVIYSDNYFGFGFKRDIAITKKH